MAMNGEKNEYKVLDVTKCGQKKVLRMLLETRRGRFSRLNSIVSLQIKSYYALKKAGRTTERFFMLNQS